MTFKKWTSLSISFLSILLTFQVCNAKESEDSIKKAIKLKIEEIFTDIKVDSVGPSPLNGIYQITAGPLVLYATKDGRYALTGDIVDLTKEPLNLTEQARKQARVKALEKLGEKNMIVYSPKDPKATITVVTDIDCGYCRKLHEQMPQMMELGLKIRYIAFPRTGPNSRSFEKAVAVWCSKDPAQALTLAKQGKEIEENASCNKRSIIEEEFNFGLQTGVMGTPTFILEDGTLIPGYLPPERLAELATQLKKQQN